MKGTEIEAGRIGRIAHIRVRPNEDLVQSVEKAALRLGFRNAFVRGTLGSLSDGCLSVGDRIVEVRGPALEILTLVGEVRSQPEGTITAKLAGAVADPEGRVSAGGFLSGRNPICVTLELTLEEWLPERTSDAARQGESGRDAAAGAFR